MPNLTMANVPLRDTPSCDEGMGDAWTEHFSLAQSGMSRQGGSKNREYVDRAAIMGGLSRGLYWAAVAYVIIFAITDNPRFIWGPVALAGSLWLYTFVRMKRDLMQVEDPPPRRHGGIRRDR